MTKGLPLPTLWHPSNGSPLDEFRFGQCLPEVVFVFRDVIDPLHHTAHHWAMVPSDVRDGGFAPAEGVIRVAANQRDVTGCHDTALGEVVFDGVEDEGLVNQQRRRRCEPKQLFEHAVQTLGVILPAW